MSGKDGQISGSGEQERAPDNSDPTGIGPPPPGATTEVTGDQKGMTHGVPVTPSADDKPSPDASAR